MVGHVVRPMANIYVVSGFSRTVTTTINQRGLRLRPPRSLIVVSGSRLRLETARLAVHPAT